MLKPALLLLRCLVLIKGKGLNVWEKKQNLQHFLSKLEVKCQLSAVPSNSKSCTGLILKANYPSQANNSSKYKSSVQTNCGPQFFFHRYARQTKRRIHYQIYMWTEHEDLFIRSFNLKVTGIYLVLRCLGINRARFTLLLFTSISWISWLSPYSTNLCFFVRLVMIFVFSLALQKR